MNARHVILPDLGFGEQPVTLSMWLVKRGAEVSEGEPVVEVMVGDVTVDLPAPADGILDEKLASAGDSLTVGQTLAIVSTF